MNSGTKFFPANSFRLVATSVVVLAVVLFAAPSTASADMITVESSSAVTFLDSGSTTTDFPAPFTPAQFAAAQTGPAAFVLASTPLYIPASDISGALWIGTNANAGVGTGDTALYAISFGLPSAVSAASLTLTYAVDNDLGDTNAGIYINEVGPSKFYWHSLRVRSGVRRRFRFGKHLHQFEHRFAAGQRDEHDLLRCCESGVGGGLPFFSRRYLYTIRPDHDA